MGQSKSDRPDRVESLHEPSLGKVETAHADLSPTLDLQSPEAGDTSTARNALPDTEFFQPEGTPNVAMTCDFHPDAAEADDFVTNLPQSATISGYEIQGELGRGGMGVVYRARQIALNRIVALKMIIAGGHAGFDQLARFHAEAEAVAQLQHPNIVQVYDVGEQGGLPFFSLEFVDGSSLDKEIAGKPQPVVKAAHMIETLARAMHYAHEHGIVHRDLKPANVLLTAAHMPKITDFGLAKQLENDSSQTRTGTIMGTPSYMAPEQGRGAKDVGPLADVYALGSMLYEMLTGRPPFLAATPLDTLMRLLHEEPVPPSRLQPHVSRDLETICLKSLQKDSRKRYVTAEALAEDLRRFQTGEPILARPVGNLERAWRWCRRNKRVAILAAVVLVLVVSLAVGGPVAALLVNRQKTIAEQNERDATAARKDAELNAEKFRLERERARAAQIAAEQNEQKAVAARKEADQNAKSAAEQRGLALEALSTLVVKVQDQLKETPATQKLKQDLLRTALDGLRKVARSARTSQATDGMMAQAYQRMGNVFQMLGQTAEARQQYEQCHAVLEMLAKADTDRARANRNLSTSFNMLGDVSYLQGDKPAARKFYSEALKLREALAQANPQNPVAQVNLATSYIKLGDVSEPDEAQTHYGKALVLRQALAASASAETRNDRQRDVWIMYGKLAELSLRSGKRPVAQDYYDQALALAGQLSAAAPESYRAKTDLAVSHVNAGNVRVQSGELETARESYGKALELLRPLADGDKENIELQGNFVLVLARYGEHAEAARKAKELHSLAPQNFRNLYNVACCYALCGGVVSRGKTTDGLTVEEQSLQRGYADQAVESLRQAITHGFKDIAYLRIDPDLEAVREHPGYRQLLEGGK